MKATELLKQDHDRVKNLFQQLKSAGSDQKEDLLWTITEEIRIHSDLEEKIFYPAVKVVNADQVITFQQEHHDIEEILNELEDVTAEDEEFDPRVQELEQMLNRHIETEEGEMFPRAEELLGDRLTEIGAKMSELKRDLSEEGREAA